MATSHVVTLTPMKRLEHSNNKELALVVVAFFVTSTRDFFVLVARLADKFGE